MQGVITKGIAGFYYVRADKTYECKAKGIFRNQGIKPLVGANVLIDILDDGKGNITKILPRENTLIRPEVANIDQVLLLASLKNPYTDQGFIDRLLVGIERMDLPAMLVFNKIDIATDGEPELFQQIYEHSGYPVLFISVKTGEGIDSLKGFIKGKTTALAGQSGVGKSSLINTLIPHANMETGEISVKSDRGKHTTRHTQLFEMDEKSFVLDTPGFSSFDIDGMHETELKDCYPEFSEYGACEFRGCVHITEPGCRVKEALEQGSLPEQRYEGYITLFNRLKENKKK
jgi:ribosome biogenesis GTPase